jgi:hypothetical protein
MKLVRLIKAYLNETCTKFCVGGNMPDEFTIQNDLKRNVSPPLLFNFALEYATWKAQESQERFEENGAHQLQVYVDDVNI